AGDAEVGIGGGGGRDLHAVGHGAVAGGGGAGGHHVIGVRAAGRHLGVGEGGAGRLGDLRLAEVAAGVALAAEDPVGRRAGGGAPFEGGRVHPGGGGQHGRGRRVRAAAVDGRGRGAGDAVAVEGREERGHVRRAVVQVPVVVVGGQPLDVAVGGPAAAGAAAAGAGVPGP